MKKFVLLGAAGFVAPRHMQAIKDVGGDLIAALDIHDSVGILDRYFPECSFFTDINSLDRFCCKNQPDYVVIATPNYLHESQCKFAMRLGADAICEKPIALTIKNIDFLSEVQSKTGKKVWVVLQCRYHNSIATTKLPAPIGRKVLVKIDYVTPRGKWYDHSWKADITKSGGLATNIGVHLFDLVTCLYGSYKKVILSKISDREISGYLELTNANVMWRLSINMNESPRRLFEINGKEYDLTDGFTNLHTKVYEEVLSGNGFGLDTAREAIRIVEEIRTLSSSRC